MRKANQQSIHESSDRLANSLLKVDPQIQKGEVTFAPENMFFPVLGIKKTINQYQKKMMKKKISVLNLNTKNELYKSQHFKNFSDDELVNKINKKFINQVNKLRKRSFYNVFTY